MSDGTHAPLQKLRTYALDQAHARGEVVVQKEKEPNNVAPTPASPEVVHEAPMVVRETSVPQPPAFHELQKSPGTNFPRTTQAPAHTAKKSITVRDQAPTYEARPSTIVVRGEKRSEFSFFAAVSKGLAQWWSKRTAAKQTSNIPSVVDSSERRKTIEKATTKTGATAITPPEQIKREITRRREDPPHESSITWSPHTEPGYPLLEERQLGALPISRPVVVHKQKTPPQAPQSYRAPEEATRRFTPPAEETGSGFEQEPVVEPIAPAPAPTPTIVAPVPQAVPPPVMPEPLPVQTAPTIVSTPVEISIPKNPNPRTSYLKNGLRNLVRFDTTLTTVLLTGTIISFVIVFFIARTLLVMIGPSEITESVPSSNQAPLIPGATVEDIALSELSREGYRNAMQSGTKQSSGILEYHLTDAAGRTLSPATLWSIFGFNTNPNLIQTITDIRVGSIQGEPALFFTVSDRTSAFGSLLAWESGMVSEVSNVLSLPVEPVLSTTDATVGTSDVRIFRGESGEVLVYGFVSGTTVVITKRSDAFKTFVK